MWRRFNSPQSLILQSRISRKEFRMDCFSCPFPPSNPAKPCNFAPHPPTQTKNKKKSTHKHPSQIGQPTLEHLVFFTLLFSAALCSSSNFEMKTFPGPAPWMKHWTSPVKRFWSPFLRSNDRKLVWLAVFLNIWPPVWQYMNITMIWPLYKCNPF